MSGPMQWTPNGLVPAIGSIPNAGETKGGFVAQEAAAVAPATYPEQVAKLPRNASVISSSTLNVLALAKARLKEVKLELRRLKALEKEKGELERLISAAENKPKKSNLREIKRSAG